METEVTIVNKSMEITNPNHIAQFSKVLTKFITENKLSCVIQGKQYVYCDGWKFAGTSFGLTAIPNKPINESKDKEIKYSCECDIINIQTQVKLSYGFAICSNLEAKKKSFDEYAIASIAQTRAIAKAYRNLLGFIMNAAGFEATPAEEAEGIKEEKQENKADISKEILEEISKFTDKKRLQDWANNLKEYHKNKKFIQAVQVQLNKLK